MWKTCNYLPSKATCSPKALAKGKASPLEKPSSHLSGCQISPLLASPRRHVVMARTLGPRDDVQLRTLSSSLAEPSTKLHLCPQGAIASHHMGPSTSPATCRPTTHRAPWSPNHRALITFTWGLFSSRLGNNQRNGWPRCLLPLRATFGTKCLSLGSQETGPCWYVGQQL